MRFEDVFFREDGQRGLIVQKFPLFDADGVVYAIGSVATDITERQHEESARRYSEEKHRLVVETANDAIISMDHTGTIQFANPASTRIFGYDPAELIGEPLTVLMPKFMRELHDNGFRRYLDTGQRHINWQGTELTALRKNGQEFPVEISFGELTRDGHKIFTGFIRDISKRKQAEDKLRASERTLRELTETIPQMLWSFGLNTLLIGELPKRESKGGLIWAALLTAGAGSFILGLGFALVVRLSGGSFSNIGSDPQQFVVFVGGVTIIGMSLVFDEATIGMLQGRLQLWRNFIFVITKLLLLPVAAFFLHDKFGAGIVASWVAGAVLSIGIIALQL